MSTVIVTGPILHRTLCFFASSRRAPWTFRWQTRLLTRRFTDETICWQDCNSVEKCIHLASCQRTECRQRTALTAKWPVSGTQCLVSKLVCEQNVQLSLLWPLPVSMSQSTKPWWGWVGQLNHSTQVILTVTKLAWKSSESWVAYQYIKQATTDSRSSTTTPASMKSSPNPSTYEPPTWADPPSMSTPKQTTGRCQAVCS